jgi:DNA-binding response OmpR family regulator
MALYAINGMDSALCIKSHKVSTMRVLLVEDDAGIKDALQMVFENAGFSVTSYSEGTPIIENNFELPDIFIIDKQLSGVDGLDICRHLKADIGSSFIPVIIISASPDTAKLAPLAGANAFLEKPFKNKDLLEKVYELTASVSKSVEEEPA